MKYVTGRLTQTVLRFISPVVTFFLFLCLLSTDALAGSTKTWLTLEGAWAQQIHSGTNYALDDNQPFLLSLESRDTNIPEGRSYFVKPNHRLSGGGALGVLWPNKIFLKFQFFLHNHTSKDHVLFDPTDNRVLLPVSAPGSYFIYHSNNTSPQATLNINQAESVFSYQIHSLDFKIGKIFSYRHAAIHPYLGINFSHLTNDQTTSYADSNEANFDLFIRKHFAVDSVGPLLGSVLSYALTPSINVMSDVDVTLLLGRSRSRLQVIASEGVPEPSRSSLSPDIQSRTTKLFERLRMKLGVAWRRPMPEYLSEFKVTAGYGITHYLSAESGHVFSSNVNPTTVLHLLDGIGYHGPFLALTFLTR